MASQLYQPLLSACASTQAAHRSLRISNFKHVSRTVAVAVTGLVLVTLAFWAGHAWTLRHDLHNAPSGNAVISSAKNTEWDTLDVLLPRGPASLWAPLLGGGAPLQLPSLPPPIAAGVISAAVIPNTTLGEALQQLRSYRALILILPGQHAPTRRGAAEPFLSVQPPSALAAPINALAGRIEAALGRRLFALRLEAADLTTRLSPNAQGSLLRPWAVYEISSGRVLLDLQLASMMAAAGGTTGVGMFAAGPAAAVVDAALALLEKMAAAVEQAAPASLSAAVQLLLAACAAAVAAAFAKPPFWFCVACPIVLGLAAPLLINFGLGAAAEAACEQMQLDPQSCTDLWLGALGVGMVLSLLSSVPIFKVCRLYECSRG